MSRASPVNALEELRFGFSLDPTTDLGRHLELVDLSEGSDPVHCSAEQWTELLGQMASEQPFRAFVLWPEEQTSEQIARFAREVVPAVRERVEHR